MPPAGGGADLIDLEGLPDGAGADIVAEVAGALQVLNLHAPENAEPFAELPGALGEGAVTDSDEEGEEEAIADMGVQIGACHSFQRADGAWQVNPKP